MKPTPDFNPAVAGKKLLREGRSGALATLMAGSGDPYCSLVNMATAADGAPLLLISRLAVHTKNILADPRVSVMIDERKEGDPLQGARIMLMGSAAATDDPDLRRRYLDRQPEAEMFAGFADFAFYRVTLKAAHLVAGFGRIVAGLGQVDLVALPTGTALSRIAGVGVIRRTDPLSAWREVLLLPPGHLLSAVVDRAVILLDPYRSQNDYCGYFTQPHRRIRSVDSLK